MAASAHAGVATVAYEEPLTGLVPIHLPEIAAIHWVGFRLVPPPECAIENLVVGKTRLPQFKDAKRGELTRLVRLHFLARTIDFSGERLKLGDWVAKWREDAALRRVVTGHAAYGKWIDALTARFQAEPLVAMAEEGKRSCFGQVGGDPATLRDFHRMMDS